MCCNLHGAVMVQWWEHSPPTNVARVWFPDSASYVGWVCWFSTLHQEFFLRVLWFSPLLKNQHLTSFALIVNFSWQCPQLEWISIKCRKTKTKVIINLANQKKDGDTPVNQSKLEVIICSWYKALQDVHVQATIGFGFTSDWLKKWHKNFEPIKWSNAKPKQFANYFWHAIENHSKELLFKCLVFLALEH